MKKLIIREKMKKQMLKIKWREWNGSWLYMSSEDDKEDDIDELNLGPDVGVNWTTVISKPSRLDDISDNDSCDSDVLHTPPDSDVEVDMERF